MDGERRKISARELVKDVRSGMSDDSLMTKYSVSSNQLRKLLKKTRDAGLISAEEYYQRQAVSLSESAVSEAFTEIHEAVQELERISKTDGTRG